MTVPAIVDDAPQTDYAALLWGGRWLIAAGLLAGVLLAIVYLQTATPRYRAYLQLVPTEQSGVSVSRNISGLASLAGVSLPKGQVSQFPLALEALKSRDVADALAGDQKLMHRLFSREWDAEHRRWREPDDALAPVKAALKTLVAIPSRPWSPPDAVAVQTLLDKNLAIEEDQKRSIATVTFTNADPILAQDVLRAAYAQADGHLRQRMDTRTAAYIDYLSRKLQQVTLAEHREALAAALAEQERTLMMARSGQPFAADPLGVISATDRPVSPNPLLALGAGAGGGLAFGAGLAFLRDWRRRRTIAALP